MKIILHSYNLFGVVSHGLFELNDLFQTKPQNTDSLSSESLNTYGTTDKIIYGKWNKRNNSLFLQTTECSFYILL